MTSGNEQHNMNNTTLTLLTLGGCITVWLVASRGLELPTLSRTRLGVGLLWLAVIYLLWVSDYPAAWRVPELIVYFSQVTLSAFRILCVTATGTVIFGSMVALLFFTRPKSRRKRR